MGFGAYDVSALDLSDGGFVQIFAETLGQVKQLAFVLRMSYESV